MPDQLDELFADLRAETITQVRPPGVAAAHRTVRRRRVVALSAVVATVALVAGGVQLAFGGARAPVATPSDSLSPQQRAERALAAATAKPGQTWAGVVSEPTWISPRTVETGAYRLYVACAGPGSIGLEIRADGRSLSGENVSCGDNPIAEEIPLAVTQRTSYVLVLNGTDEPAYAIKLIRNEGTLGDAPTPTEESAFNAGLAGDLLTAGGEPHLVTTETRRVIKAGTFGKGELLVSYACAGPGKIAFSIVTTPVGPGTPTQSDDLLECSDLGSVRGNVPTPLDGRSTVTITATPDTAATNHAGWAYLIL